MIYALTFSSLAACNGQNQSDISSQSQDFSFRIEFYPSFIASSRVEIQKKGNSKSLTIHKLFETNDPEFKPTGKESVETKYQLLVDSSHLQYYEDSIFVEQMEQIPIFDDAFQSFFKSLKNVNLVEQESLIKEGITDGITIYLNYGTDNKENNFSLRCPRPADNEFEIIKSLFALFESTFSKQETKNYLENLKGYFDFGLLVKHISNDPLEYRFYSHLSANEVEGFFDWMNGLPMNKPIILDFSNFGGMGTMFYSDFEDLIEENEEVFWLVSEHSIRQVKEIGVKKSRIFKTRKALENAMKAL